MKVTAAPYESALEEFRNRAMDYEDEMKDQFGVEDDPVAQEMWKMIKTLEDSPLRWRLSGEVWHERAYQADS